MTTMLLAHLSSVAIPHIFVILFSLSFCASLCFSHSAPTPKADRRIIQVTVLSRHCDRTPAHETGGIPKNPVNWKKQIGVDIGQLTGLGEHQCYEMGKDLKSRYLNSSSPFAIQGINPGDAVHLNGITLYDPNIFQFHASNVDRTIVSMYSIIQGMFPEGTGLMDDLIQQYALPHGIAVAPVHTIPNGDDIYLRAIHNCDVIEKRVKELPTTDTWKALNKKWIPFVQSLNEPTGLNMTNIDEFHAAYDVLNCQRSHNLLHIKEVLDQWDTVLQLASEIQFMRHSRELQSNLGGGPFIDKVHEQMKSAIDAQKDDKKQQATETAIPKYVHYSAHDTTIQSIFSTLNMSDNYKALQLGPKYGAQIVFELSQQGDEYFVTFLYRDVFNGEFRAYKLPKYCTSDVCTWNEFTRYITEVSTVPIDSWCHRCNSNRKVGTCALIVVQEPQHHRTALIITVALLVMTLLIVTPVTCVLATRRCTLARKDTSNISERNSLLAVNDRYRRH